jgi:hypothetical protein
MNNIQHTISSSNPIEIEWNCVPGASSYEVQVSNNTSFTGTLSSLPFSPSGNFGIDNNSRTFSNVLSSNCTSNKQKISLGNFCSTCSTFSYRNFYWRVRAINGSIQSSWSTVRTIQMRR